MNDIQNLITETIGLLDVIKSRKADILAFFANEEIPLETRWDLFVKAPEILVNRSPWVMRYDALDEAFGGEVVWYDDFYVERHETVCMVDLLTHDTLVENSYFKDNPDNINALKEEILSTGIRTWVYDW